jgi:hypothetical protein
MWGVEVDSMYIVQFHRNLPSFILIPVDIMSPLELDTLLSNQEKHADPIEYCSDGVTFK